MPQPQIFISSTYVDLKDARESLRIFIEQYGFKPILFEKGEIIFNYNIENEKDCYEAVKKSDLFILIISRRYGEISQEEKKNKHSKMAKYNSITRNEYKTAKESNLPIHIYINSDVNAEYNKWKENKINGIPFTSEYVDNENLFDFIDDIYNSNPRTHVRKFANVNDITDSLKQQWPGYFKKFLEQQKELIASEHQPLVQVNFYKLFYYRHKAEKDIETFAKKVNISIDKYTLYEKRNKKHKRGKDKFPFASEADIENIAMKLGLHKTELILGQEDDYSYQYCEYYQLYKRGRNNSKEPSDMDDTTITKAVVFDFDGTLTQRNHTDNLTIWEKLWIASGYSVEDCSKLRKKYSKKEIDHQTWCNKTCEAFRRGKLHKHQVDELSSKISLLPDVIKVLEYITSKGLTVHLLSGSIDVVIDNVFKDKVSLFSTRQSNGMRFDKDGIIKEIVGTKYDFEGKKTYLKELITKYNLEPFEIIYVGNSMNDRFAYLSGARTLCINPHFTDPSDRTMWTYSFEKTDLLEPILDMIFQDKNDYVDYLSLSQ